VDRRFNVALLSALNVKYLFSRYPLYGASLRLVHAPAEPPRFLDNLDYATGLVNVPPSHLADVSLADWPSRIVEDGRRAIERKRAGKDLYVYENRDVLQRFRLVQRVEALASGEAVLDRLSVLDIDALRDTALLERDDAPDLADGRTLTPGSVEVTGYAPDAIDLRTSSDGDGFLVLSMTWNPSWRATIDGSPVPLIRANHAQLGMAVPPGDHLVRLRYAPWYGGPLAIVSWLRWGP
jgi:hypothetical protein